MREIAALHIPPAQSREALPEDEVVMASEDYDVVGEWRTEAYGHVYTAKALKKVSRRILAVVSIEVPLDVEMGIRDRFGEEWVTHVEQAAASQVRQVADGWNLPAQPKRQAV